MSEEEVIRLIFSFLGGGLVAGLLNWWRAARSERKARQIESIRSQVQKLYGPLQFFTSQNARLFKLNEKFHTAYSAEYAGKQWSQDQTTQESLKRETSEVLNIANEYIEQVKKNNERILEILENHSSLIDPADVEVFSQFIVDYTRLKTETDNSSRLTTPFRIYKHIGIISFMRPEFINAVERRFNEKQAKLEKLLN